MFSRFTVARAVLVSACVVIFVVVNGFLEKSKSGFVIPFVMLGAGYWLVRKRIPIYGAVLLAAVFLGFVLPYVAHSDDQIRRPRLKRCCR